MPRGASPRCSLAPTNLGIDRARVALMGHSSGAHLAALIGTDPRYLREAGLPMDALAGVIANEGPAYDAREPSVRAGWLHRRLIAPALPGDAAALAELSPAVHAAALPNAPAFLILHAARDHGARQAAAARGGVARGGDAGRALRLSRAAARGATSC